MGSVRVAKQLVSKAVSYVTPSLAENIFPKLVGRQLNAALRWGAVWVRPLSSSNVQRSTGGSGIPNVDVPRSTRVAPGVSPTLIQETQLDPHNRQLRVKWDDGEETRYPYAWLRDCCGCSHCFHQTTMTRKLQFADINLNDLPVSVECNSQSQELVMTWSDDEHRSIFSYRWLLEHGFLSRATRWTTGRTPKLWNANQQNNISTVDFHKLMKDDHVLYNWLLALEETGLVLISNVPQVEGQLEKIAARVAFVRMTNFGPSMFVRNKDYKGNTVYTSAKLELHNDLVYYNNIPGVKMVHCIQEAPSGDDGGSSLFVDGFAAARQLHQLNADQFQCLTTVKLNFYGIGKDYLDYHLRSRHSTIKLDEHGNVVQTVYNSKARGSVLPLALEDVEPFYNALKTFAEILHSPKNVVEVNLRPGDVICLDNWRVLHGRTSFQVIPGAEAVIQRAYIDWDELHSRRRVLKAELAVPGDY